MKSVYAGSFKFALCLGRTLSLSVVLSLSAVTLRPLTARAAASQNTCLGDDKTALNKIAQVEHAVSCSTALRPNECEELIGLGLAGTAVMGAAAVGTALKDSSALCGESPTSSESFFSTEAYAAPVCNFNRKIPPRVGKGQVRLNGENLVRSLDKDAADQVAKIEGALQKTDKVAASLDFSTDLQANAYKTLLSDTKKAATISPEAKRLMQEFISKYGSVPNDQLLAFWSDISKKVDGLLNAAQQAELNQVRTQTIEGSFGRAFRRFKVDKFELPAPVLESEKSRFARSRAVVDSMQERTALTAQRKAYQTSLSQFARISEKSADADLAFAVRLTQHDLTDSAAASRVRIAILRRQFLATLGLNTGRSGLELAGLATAASESATARMLGGVAARRVATLAIPVVGELVATASFAADSISSTAKCDDSRMSSWVKLNNDDCSPIVALDDKMLEFLSLDPAQRLNLVKRDNSLCLALEQLNQKYISHWELSCSPNSMKLVNTANRSQGVVIETAADGTNKRQRFFDSPNTRDFEVLYDDSGAPTSLVHVKRGQMWSQGDENFNLTADQGRASELQHFAKMTIAEIENIPVKKRQSSSAFEKFSKMQMQVSQISEARGCCFNHLAMPDNLCNQFVMKTPFNSPMTKAGAGVPTGAGAARTDTK